jgi:hypothetical protein
MTATKITALDDGTPVLETFDFRSEFAFDDFASWVAETLDVRPISGEIQDDMEPFSFEWNGSLFSAGWNDEHGCFISTATERKDLLRQMQGALSS